MTTEIYLDEQTGMQARNIAPNAEFWFGTNSIAKRMPQLTPQEIVQATKKYVAFPSKDVAYLAPHLTGGAIDVTLADVHGKALDLGTAFDEMNEKSATRYFEQHTQENPFACQDL